MEKELDPKTKQMLKDIDTLNRNKVPLDSKGNKVNCLLFETETDEHLEKILTALENNKSFNGKLSIISTKFKDIYGLKIANIIRNNSLNSLTIWNRNLPFSDRIAVQIGEALAVNTTLKNLDIFLDVQNISPIHLMKFLNNKDSNLQSLSYLKLGTKLFDNFTEFLNKDSKLTKINFYYEPLKEVNLLYEKEISDEVLSNLSDKVQNDSNLTEVKVIPLTETFTEDINEKLSYDINVINQTLNFSCEIVKKEKGDEIYTEKEFTKQNKVIDRIIETLDRDEGKKQKHSIVSVRSYLDRAIGELLNQALYDLDVQRERNKDNVELFTVNGTIRYVAQYLLDNK